ncbi:hypothetical protein SAMN02746073_2186 [Legionella jamestowniensis DSM 19215]|nr:hypothetical protein [Legionella jamestowniensis]SFL84026.1 hypothetical protein SAMN02746073_2186 [Legionella jamestowniensis DSM 19215]
MRLTNQDTMDANRRINQRNRLKRLNARGEKVARLLATGMNRQLKF